jgi:hypothetical protein
MLSVVKSVVGGQYGAALKMLAGCVERADEAAWHATIAQFPFWHVAYHTVFCTDMYLSPGEQAFRAPPFHVKGFQFLEVPEWAPEKRAPTDRPFDKEVLTAYIATCRAKVKTTLEAETEATLRGQSGFSWIPFTRLELHLYNIRHIQHHTGQLSASLRCHGVEGVEWVGSDAV